MTIIFGLGNPNRCDDAVGLMILDALRAMDLPAGVQLRHHLGDGMGLVNALAETHHAIICDAVRGGQPGQLVTLDCSQALLPEQPFMSSSHGFGLAEAVEMARVMNMLPPKCFIVGVYVASLTTGYAVSQPVQDAIPASVQWITRHLDLDLLHG